MNIPAEFMRYNEDRRAAALEMRQRIADIRAARAPDELTGKEVLRILAPDMTAEPPLTPRSVQRHLRALRLAELQTTGAASECDTRS